MKKTTVLKRMIENNEFFVLPGGGCALHAKIAEAVGFKVAYMSGMNACATVFGVPDAGLLTLTEMVENAGRMANAVNIPLIADADPGLRQRHQRPPHGAGSISAQASRAYILKIRSHPSAAALCRESSSYPSRRPPGSTALP